MPANHPAVHHHGLAIIGNLTRLPQDLWCRDRAPYLLAGQGIACQVPGPGVELGGIYGVGNQITHGGKWGPTGEVRCMFRVKVAVLLLVL
jgi:hypothetical protein